MIAKTPEIEIPIKWHYKHLLLLLFCVPFYLIIYKYNLSFGLAAFSYCLFFILSFLNPKAGIFLFFIMLLSDQNPDSWHYDPDSIFTFVINFEANLPLHIFYELGMLSGWLLGAFFKEKSIIKKSPLHSTLIIFLLWIFLTSLQQPLRGGSLTGVFFGQRFWLNYFMFFYMFEILDSKEDLKKTFLIIIAVLFYTFFYGFFKLVTDDYTQWGLRVFILYIEQVQLLNVLGLFALIYGLEKKQRIYLLAGIPIYTITIIQLFLSTSRASLLGGIAALIVALFSGTKSKKNFLLIVFLLVIIFIFIFNYLSNDSTDTTGKIAMYSLARFQTMSGESADLSVIFRFLSYTEAIIQTAKSPLIGWGPGYELTINLMGLDYTTPILDNSYLKIALMSGVPGLVFYLIVFILVYIMAFRLLKSDLTHLEKSLLLTAVGIIVMSNTTSMFQSNFSFMRVNAIISFAMVFIAKMYMLKNSK